MNVKVITDANKQGLGAVLMEQAAEATQRFYTYVWGRKVPMETDHEPFLGILRKPSADCTPWLQQRRLKLLKFDFEMFHISGNSNEIADTLSRSGVTDATSELIQTSAMDRQALTVIDHNPFTSTRLHELQIATRKEEELNHVLRYIDNGGTHDIQHCNQHTRILPHTSCTCQSGQPHLSRKCTVYTTNREKARVKLYAR